MLKSIAKLGEALNSEQISFLNAFTKSARRSVIEMLKNSQSGHPGGSLSSLDFLSTLYAFIISQTGEDVIISNGHISPALYAILAELEYIDKYELVNNFRKIDTIYEGHVSRLINGVVYGTGPLGAGVSAASGFAFAEKIKKSNKKTYALIGDGECDEGQVYEMMNFVNKYKLNNFILFLDYNKVQLSGKLDEIMPLDIKAIFSSANWNIIEIDGHNFSEIWASLEIANKSTKPSLIVANTIMGKGVSFMEKEGLLYKSTWHGKAPSKEDSEAVLKNELKLSDDEKTNVNSLKNLIKWQPKNKEEINDELIKISKNINIGKRIVLSDNNDHDCRTAYGNALLDLAKLNNNIFAITADLSSSVKTNILKKELAERHIDCGISEQEMISLAGGLSLKGFIPFTSSFGVFLSSRAKDQARLNDINNTNVKMVATHCGLSVGEDGTTHQAIDDMGSFLGLFNTKIIEPADANQTDAIIRYISSHYGNFYVRMGRHKYPLIRKENGDVFYDEEYEFGYGKIDKIRDGNKITLLASGSMCPIALDFADQVKGDIDLLFINSIKDIDKETLFKSIKKTNNLITMEDHNPYNGMASQVNSLIAKNKILLNIYNLSVDKYQLSGKYNELYEKAKLSIKELYKIYNNLK